MTQYVFHMEMTCQGCAGAARKVLTKMGDQVNIDEISVETKTIKVTTDLKAEDVLEALRKTGKEIRLVQ